MKYYVIEQIVECGNQASKPLFVVEKEEIAKDVVKRYTGLTYFVYSTNENKDEKELEALKRVKSRLDTEDLYLFENDLKIIESALKELEEYKKCIDLKEANYVSTHKIIAVEEDTYKDLVKNSQALEIIKEERLIIYNPIEDSISTIGYTHDLPKEKVDLLKKVLL